MLFALFSPVRGWRSQAATSKEHAPTPPPTLGGGGVGGGDNGTSSPPHNELELHGEQQRLMFETKVRGVALLTVVFAIVIYPMYALVFEKDAGNMTELIAPITGIAGAIVGYWFGQASRHTDNARRRAGTNPIPGLAPEKASNF